VLTTNKFKDSQILPDLLKQIVAPIDQLNGDGSYDSHKTYEVIAALGARQVIPPRKDAVIAQHGNRKEPPLARDEVVRAIRKQGRKG
jgi:Transposase DDE domain